MNNPNLPILPIYLTGDIHGEWNVHEWHAEDLSDCYLIALGDVGIGFIPEKKQMRQIKLIEQWHKKRNIQFIGLRGNHDDLSYFQGQINLPFFKLVPDYTRMNLNGMDILMVGGAISIDRKKRKPGTSYWEDEIFVLQEDKALPCDVLLTHSAPIWNGPMDKRGIEDWCEKDSTLWRDCMKEREDHTRLIDLCKPKRHYCGHFHESCAATFEGCRSRILNINEIIGLHP